MKVKRFLLLIITLLALSIGYFLEKNYNFVLETSYRSYQDYVAKIEDKDVVYLSLNITEPNEAFISDFIDKLVTWKSDSTIIIDYVQSEDTKDIYNHILYTSNTSLIDDFKKRGAEGLDFSSFDEEGYYTTNLNDTNGEHIEIINNNLFDTYNEEIRFLTLKSGKSLLCNSESLSLFLIESDPSNIDSTFTEFLEDEGFGDKVTFTNYYGAYEGAQLDILLNDQLLDIFIIIICISAIYVLFLIISFYRQRKAILIQNIYGISLLNILSKSLINTFVLHFIVFTFIFIILLFLLTKGKYFNESLLIKQSLYIISGMIIGYVIVFMLVYVLCKLLLSIKSIKQSDNSRRNLLLVLGIKCLFLITISSQFISIIDQTIYDINIIRFINQYGVQIESLGTIDTILYGTPDDQYTVLEYYLENGYFCDFTIYGSNTYDFIKEYYGEYIDEDEINEIALTYPVIYANVNYIQSYNRTIYTSDGQKIDLNNIDKNVILVPEGCSIDDYSKYISQVYYGTDEDIEIISIKDPGLFINYAMDDTYDLTLNNPILYVVTRPSDTLSINQITIPVENKNTTEISKIIYDLTGKDASISFNNQILDLYQYNIQNDLMDNGIMVVLYLIIYISIVYESVYMFIEEFKKILVIEYLFGKSRMTRYSDLFILAFMVYIIPLICCGYMGVDIISLIKLYGITFMLEVIMIYLMIHRIETSNSSIILKGESGL
ncbi:MAG: DUF1430 domain-containing protein [Erysipelotrichaceae bacterium]|nr:DUF1430 domain-containing protein [Erysipelotrichaceae bacterium]